MSGFAFAKDPAQNSTLGVTISNALIKRYSPTIDAMGHHGWDHSNSAILHGMEKIYNNTHIKNLVSVKVNLDPTLLSQKKLAHLDFFY